MNKAVGALSFFLHKFLLPATGLFTLLTLLFSLSANWLTREKLWIIAFLAFGIAAADLLLFIKNFNLYFKLSTHFIALAGVLLCTMYLTGYMATGSWVVLLVAYIILYAIIAPVFVVLELRRKRKEKTDKTYKNIYDN